MCVDTEYSVFEVSTKPEQAQAASGAHRDIDRLATTSLREAVRRKKKLVERDAFARILDSDAAAA